MTVTRQFAWLFVVVAAGTSGFFAFRAARGKGVKPAVVQPIPFNHDKHVNGKPKLACVYCHTGAEREANAGIPSFEKCMSCHTKPQSDRAEERAVRELAMKPGPHLFKKVTREPGHVRFSHRAHVTFARVVCTQCHGDVPHWKEPPSTPNAELVDMALCQKCHRANAGPTNCVACHK